MDYADWWETEGLGDIPAGFTASDIPGFSAPSTSGGNMDDDDFSLDTVGNPSLSTDTVDETAIQQYAQYATSPLDLGAQQYMLTDPVTGLPIDTTNPSYDPSYSDVVNAVAQSVGVNPAQITVDSNGDPVSYKDVSGDIHTFNPDGTETVTNPLTGQSTTSGTTVASGTSAIGSLLNALSGGGASIGGGGSGKSSVPMSTALPASSASTASSSQSVLILGGLAVLAVWAIFK